MTITEERQPIVLPGVDPSTYTWQGLCLLLPRLVKQYYNTGKKVMNIHQQLTSYVTSTIYAMHKSQNSID